MLVTPPPTMGAHVEIVEEFTAHGGTTATLERLPCIKPRVVRVNGTDVGLIQRGSLIIDPGKGTGGEDDVATVTMTLLVRSIAVKAE